MKRSRWQCTTPPFLDANDYMRFTNMLATMQGCPREYRRICYANCDGSDPSSSTVPILDVNDFICFSLAFAEGCAAGVYLPSNPDIPPGLCPSLA
ncbi:MAG: hypothetical protein JNM80_09980 [Phycisphaerae bacterium]|nr:hypothetical protein [Phycisphaerae bacterium]